jgi:16S rRNA (cytosine1402-N4)-methyltransferase
MTIRHLPVLSGEVIELLSPVAGGTYVDATIGLGGHSEEILKLIGRNGRVIGIDRDEEALRKAADRLKDGRVRLIRGSFSDMESLVRSEGVHDVDGVLFDLGVSMMQLREAGRGFSFHSGERLDMRMDTSQELSAWHVVNRYSEKDLIRVLREYGEEFRAPRIARAIVAGRNRKTIDTCAELAAIVSAVYGGRGRIHPATKTFQAIRIEVNREMEELGKGLESSLRILKKGGRLCVISYHSLEDRAVKNFIRDRAREGMLRPLSKKPLTPSLREARENPSSRSAKLRGAEKT